MWIPFIIPEESQITAQIFNATGTMIIEVDNGLFLPGLYTSRKNAIHWDGRNHLGERVSCGLYIVVLQIDSPHFKMKSADAHEADIGYELDPPYWGHGYATEAARAIVRFGFTRLRLHRIWSWCIADNVGSARVLEKVGMRREGRLRENAYFKGRWWDTLLYGMLEDEWRASESANQGTSPMAEC